MRHALIPLFALVVGFGLTLESADARRLGGGGSAGIQRSLPMKRDAAPSRQAQPAGQPAGASRFLGPIAGLAAGLGLFALFSYLGLSEELASIVMMLLIAAAVFFVIRWLLHRLQPQTQRLQYASDPAGAPARRAATAPLAGPARAPIARDARMALPADFDVDSFLRHAKLNFVRLQAANDAGNLEDIRKFTTPEMYAEIKLQMQERGSTPQQTDVVALEAELLDFATEFGEHIASVRFHGTVREAADAEPEAFDEVWHITKPIDDGRNWAIAGIQQSA